MTKKTKKAETATITYKELELSLYNRFKAACDKKGKKYKIAIGEILRKGMNEEVSKAKITGV